MSAGTYDPAGPGAAPAPPHDRGAGRAGDEDAAAQRRAAAADGRSSRRCCWCCSRPVDIVDTGAGKAVDFLAPGVLALAVMSTAFTGQAIATGFERRYGVLKRLGASPLPRWAPDDRQDAVGAGHRGPPDRPADGDRLRARLVPAGQPLRRAAPARPRHGRLLGARPADGGHAEGGGHAGRRQPGLPAAAGGRRGDRAAGQVPGRRRRSCSRCCRSRRSRTGCGTCSSTAPGCRGATSGSSRCGRCSGWARRRGFFRWE